MEDYQTLIEKAIKKTSEKLHSSDFDDLFKDKVVIHKVDKQVVYLIVDDTLSKYRLEKFYLIELNNTLNELSDELLKIKLITEEDALSEKKQSDIKITQADPVRRHPIFRNEYTFENFMVGESNRFAFLSAMKVAENPNITYNPLYIFGDVGLGKTHLMTAVGQYILDNNVNANIVYVNTQLFVEEYFLATHSKTDPDAIIRFYNKYRQADVLLVDDIQFLMNKTSSQEEFFKVFEYLHTNNKQIIITSDREAKDLENIMTRLKSRFSWGLSVDIKVPDKTLRINILKSKLSFLIKNVNDVSEDVLGMIAELFPNNIRELEGGLRRYINYCVTLDLPFTKDNVLIALEGIIKKKDILDDSADSETLKKVQKVIAKYYSTTIDELVGKSRKQQVSYARQMATYILKEVYNFKLNKIGLVFGKRDHATISHGIDKISQMIASDQNVKKDFDNLKAKLK